MFSTFIIVSFLAGLLHVIAPDHWIPSSVITWQRGWKSVQVVGLMAVLYFFHVLGGVVLYGVVGPWVEPHLGSSFFLFTLILLIAGTALREVRFSRIREVLRSGNNGIWGILSVASLLGPAESLVPILVKLPKTSSQSFLGPIGAYFLGTVVAGTTSVLIGKKLWNRPTWLPRGIHLAENHGAVIPAMAVFVLGLAALLRFSNL